MQYEGKIKQERGKYTGQCIRLLASPSGHLRWSPCLKECEEDLDHADYCRFVLLFVKDIAQQLLYSLLSGGRKTALVLTLLCE